MFKRRGRRAWAFIAAGTVCGWLMLGLVLPAANDAVFNYKADVVAQHVADDLENAHQLARLRSQNQTVRFDRGAHHYVIPVLSDGTVRKDTVDLSQWPFWASLVDADFDGDSSVTFNIWGAADKAGEVVYRRIRLSTAYRP